MERGAYLALVLHAHLPFVRHPEHAAFAEESWLFEAITDTYIPLLRTLERLRDDGVAFQLTLSISCTLQSMLDDDLLRRRYDHHLDELQALLERERQLRSSDTPALDAVRHHYRQRLADTQRYWQAIGGDLLGQLARLLREGYLDLITSTATHGYLPLMTMCPQAMWAQIKVAVDAHSRRFGAPPSGIWLPECGYVPGIDTLLARAGLRYFIGETHALLFARPRPRYGCHAPIYCTQSGVAAFGRDPDAAEQVWSREHGYPGHPLYREFHRDLGFELPTGTLGQFFGRDDRAHPTGLKYHRITGPTEDKLPYDPDAADQLVRTHAEDFVERRIAQLSNLRAVLERPIVVAPYDAELFGHWWYEGSIWLEHVLRLMAKQPAGAPQTTHLRGYLQRHLTHQVAQPAESSWGHGGYHQYWLDGSNAWIYPRLHQATERMVALARAYETPSTLQHRALDQAARSLLLAQASDWSFIMHADTSVAYARQRIENALDHFEKLDQQLRDDAIDVPWLEQREQSDNLFPEIDFRLYAEDTGHGGRQFLEFSRDHCR